MESSQPPLLTKGFAARLRSRASERGLRQAELHRMTGLSRQALSDYFAGRKVVGTDKLFALADALEVEPRWLIQGTSGGASEARARKAGKLEGQIEDLAGEVGLSMIPEVNIGCFVRGHSDVEGSVADRLVPIRSDWLERLTGNRTADVFLARGQGDSMVPTILHDDEVLVNRADNRIRQQDGIWAVGHGELGMIKRVRRLSTGIFQLLSDNSAIPPLEAVENELIIVGRVIWIGRRV